MRKIFLCTVLITITISLLVIATPTLFAQASVGTRKNLPRNLLASSAADSILAATLQISLYPAQVGASNVTVFEQGLATLVQNGEEILLVTHDHWHYLENVGRVEFLDASGDLLLQIAGDEFTSLIRYRDGGTMLLSPPFKIHPQYRALLAARSGKTDRNPLAAARLAGVQPTQAGQIVTIAYRIGDGGRQVGLLPARVIELSERDGKATFKLQSLDGTPIQPGDSGGGIWLDGELIGNMWISEWVFDWRIWTWDSLKPAMKRLDTSIAARLLLDPASNLPEEETGKLFYPIGLPTD